MITIIFKQRVNGRWANVDATKLYSIGDIVEFKNGKKYEVLIIAGSKITFKPVGDKNGE